MSRVVWLASAGSTNTEALEQARLGVPHGWAVAARTQSGGRGRLGRVWEARPGNLYLSVVLRPDVPPDRLPWMTLGAGVVIAETLGPPFAVKWPNDVLDDQGRKVAGVLAEAEWTDGRLDALVVGIGVNLVDAPPGATHLAEHGRTVSREELAETVCRGLASLDPATVPSRWADRSCTLGRRVRIGEVEGRAVALDDDGALLVATRSGRQRVVTGDLGFL